MSLPYDDAVNAIAETEGCTILYDGAAVMCSSTLAAGEIQLQRLHHNEPGLPSVKESGRRFRFVDGLLYEAQKVGEQQRPPGLRAGKSINCV